jgi:hypothetical protein
MDELPGVQAPPPPPPPLPSAQLADAPDAAAPVAPPPASIDPELLKAFVASGARIECVPVADGLRRTSRDVVLPELQAVARCTTVRDLIRTAECARRRWARMDIFTSVDYNLEPVRHGRPEDVVVRFIFNEKRATKEIGVFSGDGSLPQFKATLANVGGRAYQLSCHATPSALRTLSYSAQLVSFTSFVGDRTEYVISKSAEPHALHFGDQERVTQAKMVVHFDGSLALDAAVAAPTEDATAAAVATRAPSSSSSFAGSAAAATPSEGHWTQSVTFGIQRRCIVPKEAALDSPSPSAGVAPLAADVAAAPHLRALPRWLHPHFAPSTKVFVKYTAAFSTVRYLPEPYYNVFSLPVGGTSFAAAAEVAGGLLGGDTALCKGEVQVTHHRTLLPWVVLDVSARAGAAVGLGAASGSGGDGLGSAAAADAPGRGWAALRANDRFFLNWRNVRGFLAVGPNTSHEAYLRGEPAPRRFRLLGGNALWAASASVNFPFPLWPSNGVVCGHIFANAGNLALVESLTHLWASLGEFLAQPVASVGCGLVAMQIPSMGPVPNGRLELNVSVPVGGLGAGPAAASPWVFDRVRWGLHWTSL